MEIPCFWHRESRKTCFGDYVTIKIALVARLDGQINKQILWNGPRTAPGRLEEPPKCTQDHSNDPRDPSDNKSVCHRGPVTCLPPGPPRFVRHPFKTGNGGGGMGRRRWAAGRRPLGTDRRAASGWWCVMGVGVLWEPPGMLREPPGLLPGLPNRSGAVAGSSGHPSFIDFPGWNAMFSTIYSICVCPPGFCIGFS